MPRGLNKSISLSHASINFSYHLQLALDQVASMTKKLKQAAKCFLDPLLLMVCLAGAVRNGAGIVWAYNSVNFFDQYHPDVNVRIGRERETERWG
jgi:hypothetical protein